MKTYVKKADNQSRGAGQAASKSNRESWGDSGVLFKDNRAEATNQKNLQAMTTNSPRTTIQLQATECVQRAIRPGEDLDAATDPMFADCANQRGVWGMPAAGTAGDVSTVAWLDDGNGHTYLGRNGHGNPLPAGMVANNISRTHAEGDVMIQAFNAGGIGADALLISDRALCGACGQRGGARGMARSVGFQTLQVQSPLNSDVNHYNLAAAPAPAPAAACFITTACIQAKGLPDNCMELTTLRAFRDQYIASKANGQEMIEVYYKNAPSIVEAISQRQDALEIYKSLYDVICRCVNDVNEGKYKSAFQTYVNMVIGLRNRFTPQTAIPAFFYHAYHPGSL
jgi:hypothetical protein